MKWTQREEMHLDYGSDVTGRNGCSFTSYSVSADGIKTDITRSVDTGPDGRKTKDLFECGAHFFDALSPDNRGKFVPWLEMVHRGEDPSLDSQPAGDIPLENK